MPMSLTSTSGTAALDRAVAASAFGASLTCAPALRCQDAHDQRARIRIVLDHQRANPLETRALVRRPLRSDAGRSAAVARGRWRPCRAPSLSTSMVPWWMSTRCLTMVEADAESREALAGAGFLLAEALEDLRQELGLMPLPVSVTAISY